MKYTFKTLLFLLIALPVFAQKVEVSPLSVNSRYDDFGATFANNGRLIFFTSEREADGTARQKIFTSSGWSSPQELPEAINAGKNNGSVALTPDGQYMIFAAFDRSDNLGRTDLYSAERVRGEWTNVKNLGPNVNSTSWDSQPTLSSDGTTLYFASDRAGGQGGTDIYVSRREGGSWGKATNIGSVINSTFDEMTPTIAPDNTTFYFSSNRPALGGFDIYSSSFKNSNFSRPIAFDEPINSSADEYFYTALPNSTTAYFSSNRSGGSGALDLYTAVPNPVPPAPVRIVTGIVRDANTSGALGSTIYVTDLKTGKRVAELHSDDMSGEYFVTLTSGRRYSITSSKSGYLFYSEQFEVPEAGAGNEVKYDINLSPISQGRTRLLVFFDFDKSELKDESRSELERIAEFLQSNPAVKVEIGGHTDDQGAADYNDKLSADRANAVKKYLTDNGIPAARITTKGYGKRQPLIQGTDDEARAQNRRVEMVIK
jgi:outer membrane protein OmpA-like peptidoglycan-associated protein